MHNLLNEFADLSQRLEHLVAYSSQMVFVSGEQMGNQQKFVEAFLGARQNEVDVIYMTGNSFHGEDDVRQEFAKQLLGKAPTLEVSLLQLLSTRENKGLPLLIAVTRAERLPDQILQELWDLVLQNRFARNKQQINILLFGEQEWSERTKAWLPTNNNDKPVLLTSETVEVQAEQEIEGDLDAYIKSKRKEFNQRLKTRALAYEPSTSVWKNWWIRLLAVCTFIVCFSGILIWQYFDLTQSAIDDFTNFLFQNETVSPTDEWQEAQALLAETESLQVSEGVEQAQENDILEVEDQSNQKLVTSWQEESQKLERQSIELNLPEEQTSVKSAKTANMTSQPEVMTAAPGGMEFSESESLVTISKEQLLKLQPKTTESAAQAEPQIESQQEESANAPTQIASNQEDLTQETKTDAEPVVLTEPLIPNELSGKLAKQLIDSSELVGPPSPEPLIDDTVASSVVAQPAPTIENVEIEAGAVEDYPVQDIVSVEELQQQAEAPAVSPPEATILAGPSYEFNESILLNLPDSDHLLQVSGISSRSVLDQYLVDNKLTNLVWVYKTKRYGGDWYVVLYNKNFNSLNSARDSVSELPRTTRQSAPFAKSIAMIRKEISQGYPEN